MNSKNFVSFPDLSAGTTQTLPYTAPSDGFIYWRTGGSDGRLMFNNQNVEQSGSYYDQTNCFLPVKSGWNIKLESGGTDSFIFYPSLNA